MPSELDSEDASLLEESARDEDESSLLLQELDDDDIGSHDHSHVIVHHCQIQEPLGQEELEEELHSDDELSDDQEDSLLQELEEDDIGSHDHSHVIVHHCQIQEPLGQEELEEELHSDDDESDDELSDDQDDSLLQELDDDELPSSHSHVMVHQCHAQMPEHTDELEEELESDEDSDDEESEEEESELEASEELDSDEEDDESVELSLEEVLFGLQTQRISLMTTPPMSLTCFSSVHFSPAPHESTPRHLAHICFAEPPLSVNVYSVYPSGHFFVVASGSTVVTLHFPSAHSEESDDSDESDPVPPSEQNSPLLESEDDESEELETDDDDELPSQDHTLVSVHHCHTHEPFEHDELEELHSDDDESEEDESDEELSEEEDDSTEETDESDDSEESDDDSLDSESVELALEEEELLLLHAVHEATSFFTQRVASGLSSESLQTEGLLVQSVFVPWHTEPMSHPMSSPASVTPLPHRLMHAKLQEAWSGRGSQGPTPPQPPGAKSFVPTVHVRVGKARHTPPGSHCSVSFSTVPFPHCVSLQNFEQAALSDLAWQSTAEGFPSNKHAEGFPVQSAPVPRQAEPGSHDSPNCCSTFPSPHRKMQSFVHSLSFAFTSHVRWPGGSESHAPAMAVALVHVISLVPPHLFPLSHCSDEPTKVSPQTTGKTWAYAGGAIVVPALANTNQDANSAIANVMGAGEYGRMERNAWTIGKGGTEVGSVCHVLFRAIPSR